MTAEQKRRKIRYWKDREQAIKKTQAWYATNKEKVAERGKLWRAKNKDRLRKLAKAYYRAHREKIKTRSAAWTKANPEKNRARYHRDKDKHRARRAEYRKNNLEMVRLHDRVSRYGISAEYYNALVKAQDNKCAICKRPERATYRGVIRNLCVDHDHMTDAIRGLLCSACNTSIGKFEDNPDFIMAALEYVLAGRQA